jgi:hypothetical protein
MRKLIYFLFILMPFQGFSQFAISGRVINKANNQPVGFASVFLANSSIGTKTNENGYFNLQNISPGKYDLLASSIGFETIIQSITINSTDFTLPDIFINPKNKVLSEVVIRSNSESEKLNYLAWFKEEFLGKSILASECKILNPDILDLDYDKTSKTLTVSASDFVEIENYALGYKIKYLLKDFELTDKGEPTEKIHYEGSALFEKMKGSPSQNKRWQKNRQQDYEGSPMHFLRSLVNDPVGNSVLPQFFREGFWVMRLVTYFNPLRPSDSIIRAKINYFKKSSFEVPGRKDSILFWSKKENLPKTLQKLIPEALRKEEIVKITDQRGIYALGLTRQNYSLFINYNKYRTHKFKNGQLRLDVQPIHNLSEVQNTENTLVSFNEPYAFFDRNGRIINFNAVTFQGVWGRRRMADFLPLDYISIPTNNRIEDDILAKLNNFTRSHITEKAYLQLDRSTYTIGDTIYFKAYVTKGESHMASDVSRILHVDLINPYGEIEKSIKLYLDSGFAYGDFAVPGTAQTGNYQVKAYTNWMKNEGLNYNFIQKISVIEKGGSQKIGSSTGLKTKPLVQFFPEGGRLVVGVRSKVAFTAIGADGLAADIKGIIIDGSNRQVTAFKSSQPGMGYFTINPELDAVYKAVITFSDSTKGIFNLPDAILKGVVLSVNNDSTLKAWITVHPNTAYYVENKNKDHTLIISSGDVNTKIICPMDSMVTNVDIIKSQLTTGVARFTLFSPNGDLLCDRLLFIQNHDQLNLRMSSEKLEYKKGEKIHINLKASNAFGPARGHFSVSVITGPKSSFEYKDEQTIKSYILLTSDLKGFIEQPNFYFSDTTFFSRNNLDVLMLTQCYTHFTWKEILNFRDPQALYQPETFLTIKGMVKNLDNKTLAAVPIGLKIANYNAFYKTKTDENGCFIFDSLSFQGTRQVILSIENEKLKNSVRLFNLTDYNSPGIYRQTITNDVVKNIITDTTVKNDKISGREVKDTSTTTGTLSIPVVGYYKAHEFYFQNHSHIKNSSTDTLKRVNIIYWNPDITSDKKGNTSFEFVNSDEEGKYFIIIEGIDNQGNLGRQVFEYNVGE